MAQSKAQKKGLGRGLSALIPTDMDFLAEVARGDFSVLAPSSTPHEADNTEFNSKSGSYTKSAPASVNPQTRPSKSTIPSEQEADVSRETVEDAVDPAQGLKPSQLESWVDAGTVPRSSRRPGTREANAEGRQDMVYWIEPGLIQANPYQPRRHFEESEMANLAESIREHGVLQPIIVRPIGMSQGFGLDAETGGHRYQLIAGERRWRAAQRAGLEQVPVVVREVSDQQALELAIIENVQRHDISALDAALAYKRLGQEFGLSQEKIAQRVGKARPSIANTMRLLDLPSEAQEAIADSRISEGHGRAILLAPREAQRTVLRAILREKHSVREAEEFARRIARQAERDAASGHPKHENESGAWAGALGAQEVPEAEQGATQAQEEDAAIEEGLQRALSCRVQVRRRRAGGQIVLFANDDGQLARLVETLGVAGAKTKR